MKSLTTFCIVFICVTQVMVAQNLPQIKFLSDSTFLGSPIKLSLVYRHPIGQEVVFPDSSFDYVLFEYISHEFFTTVSDSATSTDSAVYTLSTFEFSQNIPISIPVFIFNGGDTSKLYSNTVEIYLKEVITPASPPDSLRSNTNYLMLDSDFNYPLVGISSVSLIIIGLLIFILFRKKLMAQYSLIFVKRDYQKFIKKYEELAASYEADPRVGALEDLLSEWKKYLQKLEKIPFTTLTTKEIAKIIDQNQLTSSLQNFDRSIYSGYKREDMTSSIDYLRLIAEAKVQQRQKSLRDV